MSPRLGFFTRLLDAGSAAQRYRIALDQIETAERLGYHSAWIAQHHFNPSEGGLPSPFVFLGAAAQRTRHIRLATGIVTLAHENPIRVAEDAAVVDALSDGRLEIGLGTGASVPALAAFGFSNPDRKKLYTEHLAALREALSGAAIGDTDRQLYPDAPGLSKKLWQATFSTAGGYSAGSGGDGLLLSRSQPRAYAGQTLNDLQNPVIDAYLEGLSQLAVAEKPRILASRTLVVVDQENRERVLDAAVPALRMVAKQFQKIDASSLSEDELLAVTDSFFGTPAEVIDQLSQDEIIHRSTDVSFQVHSIDPDPEITLRSLELIATEIAPALNISLRGE